jgi:hypothetical protein
MAKRLFVFCDGPHNGPCPNRFVRLLREMAEQGVTYSQGCNPTDVFRQIMKLGRGRDDLSCEGLEDGACPHGADKPYFDKKLGELWARGECLHSFAAQACNGNEVAILKKLQARHWPWKIFNPLGKGESNKYGATLKEIVCRLNQCQKMIEFHSHPKSRAVSWKWRLT